MISATPVPDRAARRSSSRPRWQWFWPCATGLCDSLRGGRPVGVECRSPRDSEPACGRTASVSRSTSAGAAESTGRGSRKVSSASPARSTPLRRTSCLREDQKVIGIADERQATPLQLLVQVIQEDVGRKWRERTALRRALRAGLQNPFDHHARPQASFPPWVAPEQLLSPRALPIGAVTWSVDLLQAPNLAQGTYTPYHHARDGRTSGAGSDGG